MSKILPIDPSQAQPKSAELLAGVAKMMGATPNLFKIAAHAPSALESMVAQFGAAAHGRLPAKTREAIALAVAEANGCDYCLLAHTALGKGAGLSDGEMTAARGGEASDPKLAAILGFARSLVKERGRAPDASLALMRNAGVTDGEILEVIANVALNVFTNYVNIALDTEIDFPVVRAVRPV